MLDNLISDFTQNAWWELIVVVMMTSIARIFRLTFGKKMTVTHEIVFWCICIFCGTVALAAVNVGILKPIQNQFSNKQTASPDLHCEIVTIGTGHSEEQKGEVLLFVRIVNSGSPTIVWKWRLGLELTTGQKFESLAPDNQVVGTVTSQSQRPPMTLDVNHYLPNMLLESPIQTGAGKFGWVAFVFSDVSQSDLERIGNKFTLRFEDSEGKRTEITKALPNSPQYRY